MPARLQTGRLVPGFVFSAFLGVAAPFEAYAQSKPPLGVAPPPPQREYVPPDWWDDEDRALQRRYRPPPREPWPTTRKPQAQPQPKTEPAKAASPWTAPLPPDEALARCDTLRQRYEQVMRAEMRGNDPATAERLRAERQGIYQEQLRAGC